MSEMLEAFTPPKARGTSRKWSPLEPSDVDYGVDGGMYVCMSFDPGLTTGWAVFGCYMVALRSDKYRILENIDFWSAGEFRGTEREVARQMLSLAAAWPDAHIVCEDFILRQYGAQRELLAPVRITARFDQGLEIAGDERKIILQQPALAMTTVTDDRLKSSGFWNPTSGQPHARDAIRHNITWLRRAKEILKVQVHDEEES